MTAPRRRPWLLFVGIPVLVGALLYELHDRRPILSQPMAHAEDPAAAAPVVSALAPFALLELFTSEGCSSCPPAEALLGEIGGEARRQERRVICLAWHVDYWDHLGWTDPFGSRAHTVRQRRYAQRMRLRSIYTPQLVVNGREELVGSSRGGARGAIERALRAPAAVSVTLRREPGPALRVAWTLGGELPADARLVLCVTERGLVTAVPSGENAGRELHHEDVVRGHLERAAAREGAAELPCAEGVRRERASVVAFVQAARMGEVLGVARLDPQP